MPILVGRRRKSPRAVNVPYLCLCHDGRGSHGGKSCSLQQRWHGLTKSCLLSGSRKQGHPSSALQKQHSKQMPHSDLVHCYQSEPAYSRRVCAIAQMCRALFHHVRPYRRATDLVQGQEDPARVYSPGPTIAEIPVRLGCPANCVLQWLPRE